MKNVTVLMVVHDFWAYLFRNRKHHVAEFLAAQDWVREVIFCEPPLPAWVLSDSGQRRLASLDPAFCGGFRARCEALLRGYPVARGQFLPVGQKLLVFAPHGVGSPDPRSPLLDAYAPGDAERTLEAVRELLKLRNPSSTLLWMHSPFVPQLVDAVQPERLVYDCTDHPSCYAPGDPDTGRALERGDRQLLARADLVFAVSEELAAEKRAVTDRVAHLPNGCDFEHFSRAAHEPLPIPDDIAGLPDPVLGYFGRGTLFGKIDVPLIVFLAARHPEWHFLFIGLPPPPQPELRLPNLHFIGHRPYAQLPAYARRFAACLLPHRDDPVTRHMDPIKLYEYLATGKPVVSTPIAGTAALADGVSLGSTWLDFERRVEDALGPEQPESRAGRMELARQHSWERRFAVLSKSLHEYCFAASDARAEPIPVRLPA